MATKKHRVLATNPKPKDGPPEVVVQDGTVKYYIICPVEEGLYEIYFGKAYLGESTSLKGAEQFLDRGGATAPVLIQNPNGGYTMYEYNRPSKSNPSKKKRKKATKTRAKKKPTKKRTYKLTLSGTGSDGQTATDSGKLKVKRKG